MTGDVRVLSARQRWVELGLACVAMLVFFLPSHSVYATTALDFRGLACAMMPDCHPGPSQPVHDTGSMKACSFARDDTEYIELITLWVLFLAAAATAWKANAWISAAQVAVAVFELGLFGTHSLAHLFERVEILWFGNLYPMALGAVAIVALWRIFSAWRARRARALSETQA